MDAQAVAAFTEVLNRLGALLYGIAPPGGATSEGEISLRLRQISDQVGRVEPAQLASITSDIVALQQDVAAIKAALKA